MIKVFNYKCADCAHTWEAWLSTVDGEVLCPACESTNTVKMPTATRVNWDKKPYDEYL